MGRLFSKSSFPVRRSARTFAALLIVASMGLWGLFGLAACAQAPRLPGTSGGTAVNDVAQTVENKAIDLYTNDLQLQISEAVKVALELSQLEGEIEALCSRGDNSLFYDDLDALQKRHSELLDSGIIKVADARSAVDDGIEWVTAYAEQSEQAAQDTQYFMQQLENAKEGLSDVASLMVYEQKQLAAHEKLGYPPGTPELEHEYDYYNSTWTAHSDYEAIEAPQCMADLHERFVRLWEMAGTFFYNDTQVNSSSELNRRSLVQMVDWISAREKIILRQQSWVAGKQYSFASDLITSKLSSDDAPMVEFRAIERISPNLYQSLDSVLDLTICATHEQDVIIEVEIAGFTLAHTTKLTLQPGVNYFELKPELLPSLGVVDLESASTTQLNYRMTSPDGTVVDAQSASVEVLTLYDYLWYNDNFGYAAQYELFAWLRPGQPVIDDLIRRAADYVGEWTDGLFREINGYQYGDDWYGTLLQVAAIQKAFSDSDIAYVIDTYTPRADQRVLTAAAVFEKRQALCIESSLVMASALLSAGMHPMIIITPTHAQVAVETWADSGQYFLIETTQLPYSGLDRGIDSAESWAWGGLTPVYDDGWGSIAWVETGGSSDTWVRYFNWVQDFDSDSYGGIFVLDCYLQRTLNITGLEAF